MKSMEGILKEELLRLRSAERSYKREVSKLPNGSIQKRRIKGSIYSYLVFRKNGKIVYKYLGRPSKFALKELQDRIKLRKEYRKQLREVRENKKRIMKMLYGRKKTV